MKAAEVQVFFKTPEQAFPTTAKMLSGLYRALCAAVGVQGIFCYLVGYDKLCHLTSTMPAA